MPVMRAPPGGIAIDGVQYIGGQFIPSGVLEGLSPQQKEQARAGVDVDTHGDKPPDRASVTPAQADEEREKKIRDWKENGFRSTAFKSWFGDWEGDPASASKVVGKDGPSKEYFVRKVYKGVRMPEGIEALDPNFVGKNGTVVGAGFYFAENIEIARNYANPTYRGDEYTGKILECYLAIKNPLVFEKRYSKEEIAEAIAAAAKRLASPKSPIKEWGKSWDALHENRREVIATLSSEVARRMQDSGGDSISGYLAWFGASYAVGKFLANMLVEAMGFDGIAHRSRDEMGTPIDPDNIHWSHGDHGQCWIAFHPEQVKGADNIGTFDPTDRRLRMAWERYQGPRGGRGWKNTSSGDVAYQEDAPEERGEAKQATLPGVTIPSGERKTEESVFQDREQRIKDWEANGLKSKTFKSWFGDWEADPENASKVADEDGPTAVYKGMALEHSPSFLDERKLGSRGGATGKGFYFVDSEDIARDIYANRIFNPKTSVLKAYLNIRNPLDFDKLYADDDLRRIADVAAKATGTDAAEVYAAINKARAEWWKSEGPSRPPPQSRKRIKPQPLPPDYNSMTGSQQAEWWKSHPETEDDAPLQKPGSDEEVGRQAVPGDALWRALASKFSGDRVNEILAKAGYDGLTHRAGDDWAHPGRSDSPNTYQYAPSARVWMAFSANQVKAANNLGLFDTKDNRLRMAWERYQGPRGGRGWKNAASGEVLYQDEAPGENKQAMLPGVPPASPVGERKTEESVFRDREQRIKDWQTNGVKSKTFKSWFGDWETDPKSASKAVDDSGQPLEVYKGISSPDEFAELNPSKMGHRGSVTGRGWYFTDSKKVASGFSNRRDVAGYKGSSVLSCYLNVRNPFDFDKPLPKAAAEKIAKAALEKLSKDFRQYSPDPEKSIREYQEYLKNRVDWTYKLYGDAAPAGAVWGNLMDAVGGPKEINAILQEVGYDGIVNNAADDHGHPPHESDFYRGDDVPAYIRNEAEFTPAPFGKDRGFGRTWIVFDSSQVKATNNLGLFDPKDSRLRMAAAGGIAPSGGVLYNGWFYTQGQEVPGATQSDVDKAVEGQSNDAAVSSVRDPNGRVDVSKVPYGEIRRILLADETCVSDAAMDCIKNDGETKQIVREVLANLVKSEPRRFGEYLVSLGLKELDRDIGKVAFELFKRRAARHIRRVEDYPMPSPIPGLDTQEFYASEGRTAEEILAAMKRQWLASEEGESAVLDILTQCYGGDSHRAAVVYVNDDDPRLIEGAECRAVCRYDFVAHANHAKVMSDAIVFIGAPFDLYEVSGGVADQMFAAMMTEGDCNPYLNLAGAIYCKQKPGQTADVLLNRNERGECLAEDLYDEIWETLMRRPDFLSRVNERVMERYGENPRDYEDLIVATLDAEHAEIRAISGEDEWLVAVMSAQSRVNGLQFAEWRKAAAIGLSLDGKTEISDEGFGNLTRLGVQSFVAMQKGKPIGRVSRDGGDWVFERGRHIAKAMSLEGKRYTGFVPASALRMAWERYQGSRGGRGWKNTATGRVVYQDKAPQERGKGGQQQTQPQGPMPKMTDEQWDATKARLKEKYGGIPQEKMLASMPDKPDNYFNITEDAKMVPISAMRNTRARPEGIGNALLLMYGISQGEGLPKRKPISLIDNGDGTFDVDDGNSTFAIAKGANWNALPATIKPAGTVPDGHDAHDAADSGQDTQDRAGGEGLPPDTKSPPVINTGASHQEMAQPWAGQRFKSKEQIYSAASQLMPSYQQVLDLGVGVSAALGGKAVQVQSKEDFGKLLDRFSSDEKGPVVILAPIKGEKRAAEKAAKYGNDWAAVTDVTRATIAVDTMAEMPKAFAALRQHCEKNGWKIGFVHDRINKPMAGGYRDMMILIEHKESGYRAEVQLNTKAMIVAKERDGHDAYEERRVLEEQYKDSTPPPEVQQRIDALNKKMEQIYGDAWNKVNPAKKAA